MPDSQTKHFASYLSLTSGAKALKTTPQLRSWLALAHLFET
jgi:hypothetical protein